jgi:hypothetical protein
LGLERGTPGWPARKAFADARRLRDARCVRSRLIALVAKNVALVVRG